MSPNLVEQQTRWLELLGEFYFDVDTRRATDMGTTMPCRVGTVACAYFAESPEYLNSWLRLSALRLGPIPKTGGLLTHWERRSGLT